LKCEATSKAVETPQGVVGIGIPRLMMTATETSLERNNNGERNDIFRNQTAFNRLVYATPKWKSRRNSHGVYRSASAAFVHLTQGRKDGLAFLARRQAAPQRE